MTIEVQGGARLRRTLKEASGGLEDMRPVHREAADIAAEASAALAPVATGRLRKTIRGAGTKTAAIIRAGNNRKTAAGVPYAGPIHWGWFKRGIKPQPFLSDGAQNSEGKWQPRYFDYLNQWINKVEGK